MVGASRAPSRFLRELQDSPVATRKPSVPRPSASAKSRRRRTGYSDDDDDDDDDDVLFISQHRAPTSGSTARSALAPRTDINTHLASDRAAPRRAAAGKASQMLEKWSSEADMDDDRFIEKQRQARSNGSKRSTVASLPRASDALGTGPSSMASKRTSIVPSSRPAQRAPRGGPAQRTRSKSPMKSSSAFAAFLDDIDNLSLDARSSPDPKQRCQDRLEEDGEEEDEVRRVLSSDLSSAPPLTSPPQRTILAARPAKSLARTNVFAQPSSDLSSAPPATSPGHRRKRSLVVGASALRSQALQSSSDLSSAPPTSSKSARQPLAPRHSSQATVKSSSSSVSSSRKVSDRPAALPAIVLSPLEELLEATRQPSPMSFSTLLTRLEDEARGDIGGGAGRNVRWSKVAEASYSEVFQLVPVSRPSTASGVMPSLPVVKVIPLRAEDDELDLDFEEGKDVPDLSDPKDVGREVEITRTLSGLQEGFVELKAAFVARGRYPARLLSAWDAFAEQNEGTDDCQNLRPDMFDTHQLYAVLTLSNGGLDVEHAKLRSWTEAASVFWQVVKSLARAEGKCEFEHRDLHWGNVLVSPLDSTASPSGGRLRQKSRTADVVRKGRAKARSAASPSPLPEDVPGGTTDRKSSGKAGRRRGSQEGRPRVDSDHVRSLLDPQVSKVRSTIIDYTLSRALVSGPRSCGQGAEGRRPIKVAAYLFEDQGVFDGEGDRQFDVYRSMREHTGEKWDEYRPLTNLMWLDYLCEKLLVSKGLKEPSVSSCSSSSLSLATQRVDKAWSDAASHASLLQARRYMMARMERGEGCAAEMLRWALGEGEGEGERD